MTTVNIIYDQWYYELEIGVQNAIIIPVSFAICKRSF